MANTIDAFFNNMAAAFDDASKALAPQSVFLTGDNGNPIIYTDVRSEPQAQYKTVTLQVPNTPGDAVNAITTAPTAANLVADATTVQLDYMPAWGFVLTSLEELTVMSPQQLRTAYVDESIKKIARAANKKIADLFVVGNYNKAGNLTGTAGLGVQLSEFTKMYGTLGARDVPVDDAGNMFFVAHTDIYSGLLNDEKWRNAAIVGDARATNQFRSGVLPLTYGALPLRDNQVPSPTTGNYNSIYMHRNAAALVTAPLPAPPATVDYMYNSYGPLQILTTIKYVADQPRLELWFHALMGVTKFRTDHAVIHTSVKAS